MTDRELRDRAAQFSVGDVVVVRDWDDMLAEFGDHDDPVVISLPRGTCFVDKMQEYCGHEYIITKCDQGDREGFYKLEALGVSPDPFGWSWSAEMLEHVRDSEPAGVQIGTEAIRAILMQKDGNHV